MTFLDAFQIATTPESATALSAVPLSPVSKRTPYAYQCRLAGGAAADSAGKFSHGTDCNSQLIDIPTGLGKTAAVILAWLWNRVLQPNIEARQAWPRRLVYCLPMRTLVEQTAGEVKAWLEKLNEKYLKNEALIWLKTYSPIILMGGEDLTEQKREWDIHPEREAILIGTQDMLLSRALNRGYGMSRYRWPMHFALLNNDALWILDETQLMGVGVETSAQLDGFRAVKKFPTYGGCLTWWMSATLQDSRLATVDHPKPPEGWPTQKLSEAEKSSGRSKDLITAPKKLSTASIKLNAATKGNYAKQLSEQIVDKHQPGTLTLVILNRVQRAREVYDTLVGKKTPQYPREKVALIHSRFRPIDRERHTKLLFAEGDRIVVATQAVEAGVDVSARLLITELAPWSSLVQRMGRCNRRADIPDSEVLWVDISPKDERDDLSLPYSETELKKARDAIASLSDACSQSLREIVVPEEPVIRPVIRRRDLMDLFDTTPDLCGQDLDVSRYIRDGEDSDVQFYWREIKDDQPAEKEPDPERLELCRVSIGDAAKFFKKDNLRAWRWNPLVEEWESANRPHPGSTYLVDAASGGYDDDRGWTGDPKDHPTPHPPPVSVDKKGYWKDPNTFSREWQTLAEHTGQVVQATDTLVSSLALDAETCALFHIAALWHDIGKAHSEFQKSLHDGPHSPVDRETFYAKSKNRPKPHSAERPYRSIRHELASALAWLLKAPDETPERDLVAYLIAAHHGKVRLSIRSLPEERGNPECPEALFARGIWDGDVLPPIPGLIAEPTTLSLDFMKMGEGHCGPSWLARTVALRDRFGPFHLAYLETILRAADARASKLAK